MGGLRRALVPLALAITLSGGCQEDSPAPAPTPTPTPTPVGLSFDFATDSAGWVSGYADYSDAEAPIIDFVSGLRQLPAPLSSRSGFLLGGNNHSDDLAMFISREIENLEDNRAYRIEAEVVIASNVPEGCAGVGGSPGEGVYIKAGAAPRRPDVSKDSGGWYRVNVDKANQAQSGSEAVVIGNFAAPGAGTCNAGVYTLKTLPVAAQPPVVSSNSGGRLWLFLATDSAFEARTEIYFLEARFRLVPI